MEKLKTLKLKNILVFLPYEQLPTSQKAKDYIFRQTIHSLKKFLKD